MSPFERVPRPHAKTSSSVRTPRAQSTTHGCVTSVPKCRAYASPASRRARQRHLDVGECVRHVRARGVEETHVVGLARGEAQRLAHGPAQRRAVGERERRHLDEVCAHAHEAAARHEHARARRRRDGVAERRDGGAERRHEHAVHVAVGTSCGVAKEAHGLGLAVHVTVAQHVVDGRVVERAQARRRRGERERRLGREHGSERGRGGGGGAHGVERVRERAEHRHVGAMAARVKVDERRVCDAVEGDGGDLVVDERHVRNEHTACAEQVHAVVRRATERAVHDDEAVGERRRVAKVHRAFAREKRLRAAHVRVRRALTERVRGRLRERVTGEIDDDVGRLDGERGEEAEPERRRRRVLALRRVDGVVARGVRRKVHVLDERVDAGSAQAQRTCVEIALSQQHASAGDGGRPRDRRLGVGSSHERRVHRVQRRLVHGRRAAARRRRRERHVAKQGTRLGACSVRGGRCRRWRRQRRQVHDNADEHDDGNCQNGIGGGANVTQRHAHGRHGESGTGDERFKYAVRGSRSAIAWPSRTRRRR